MYTNIYNINVRGSDGKLNSYADHLLLEAIPKVGFFFPNTIKTDAHVHRN